MHGRPGLLLLCLSIIPPHPQCESSLACQVFGDGHGNQLVLIYPSLTPLQVVGDNHGFTQSGGVVFGTGNQLAANGASILGGSGNTGLGLYSEISGGRRNTAYGYASTISGGVARLEYGLSVYVLRCKSPTR